MVTASDLARLTPGESAPFAAARRLVAVFFQTRPVGDAG